MKTLYESLLDINDVESSIDSVAMVDSWCKDNIMGIYVIDKKTLVISSPASITITNKELERFPSFIQFGTIRKDFSCSNCDSLKSLKGVPKEVGANFFCSNCSSLKSLEGAPEKVGRDFSCKYCTSLTSLEGAPEKIGGDFYCNDCDSLESLEGAPKEVGGDFYCTNCPALKSLKDAPTHIKGKIFSDEDENTI